MLAAALSTVRTSRARLGLEVAPGEAPGPLAREPNATASSPRGRAVLPVEARGLDAWSSWPAPSMAARASSAAPTTRTSGDASPGIVDGLLVAGTTPEDDGSRSSGGGVVRDRPPAGAGRAVGAAEDSRRPRGWPARLVGVRGHRRRPRPRVPHDAALVDHLRGRTRRTIAGPDPGAGLSRRIVVEVRRAGRRAASAAASMPCRVDMTCERFLMNAVGQHQQGQQLNVGKDSPEYQAIVGTLTMHRGHESRRRGSRRESQGPHAAR